MSVLGRRRRDIETEAAAWVIRLGHGPLREDERQEFDRWLGENPVNRTVFDRAQSTWEELAELRTSPGTLLDDIASSPQPFVPFGWRGPTVATLRRAAAIVVLVMVSAGFGVFWFGDPLLLLEADYRTAPGESRNVMLADGSQIQLGTDSALAVHFDSRSRRVALLSGEAYFAVAPKGANETRPFVVEAANGTATALGTEFMVNRSGEDTAVTVVEHQVQVEATSTAERRSIVLSPGESVRYDRGGDMGKATEVNLRRATSWRRGQLVFDKARLADVVAELSRYRRGRIVIADASLADRRVSGFFQTDDLDGALASMIRELGVRTASLPPFVTVLY